MATEVLEIAGDVKLDSNRFTLAGWLAIVGAVTLPLGVGLGIAELVSGIAYPDEPGFYLSDWVGLIGTCVAIYVLLRFRTLLHERYEYHGIDGLIIANIVWLLMHQLVSLYVASTGAMGERAMLPIIVVYMCFAAVTVGVIDIVIAARLLKSPAMLNDMIKAFAYITLAMGICEVTMLFMPLALLMIPVSMVILALVFFRSNDEELEFV